MVKGWLPALQSVRISDIKGLGRSFTGWHGTGLSHSHGTGPSRTFCGRILIFRVILFKM